MKKSTLVYFSMFIFKFFVSIVQCQPNCNCVPFTECKEYVDLLEKSGKPLSQKTIKFLRENQCGIHDGKLKICCREITKGEKCKNCTMLNNCTPYMNLLSTMPKPLKPEIVQFLRSQECGFKQGFPMVCCSALPKSIVSLKNSKSGSRRIKNNKLTADEGFFKERDLSSKIKEINAAFSDSDAFDLMLRKKRNHSNDTYLDIEIR